MEGGGLATVVVEGETLFFGSALLAATSVGEAASATALETIADGVTRGPVASWLGRGATAAEGSASTATATEAEAVAAGWLFGLDSDQTTPPSSKTAAATSQAPAPPKRARIGMDAPPVAVDEPESVATTCDEAGTGAVLGIRTEIREALCGGSPRTLYAPVSSMARSPGGNNVANERASSRAV